jgi:hypothetical protein
MNTHDILDQREADHAIKNYTRVPNMLVDGYQDLHPQDKWLFVCLVRLCGKEGTRYLSLRFIAKKTGFSPSVLSDNKKNGKPGMIGRLHNSGLIHAEIKRRLDGDGEEEKQAQYHITITNTWALNYEYYNPSNCSKTEQSDNESVLIQNATVLKQNAIGKKCSDSERNCSKTERECSDSGTILRLHSKTTDKITKDSKITSKEIDTTANASVATSSSSNSLLAKKEEKENPTPEPTTEQGATPPTKKETAPRRSVGSRKPAKEKEAVTLSPEAQKVYEEWCKMPWFKVKPELTETLAAHCEVAKHYKPTAEIMLKVKNYATSSQNDKNGFYKGKGWNFKFMLNELPQWLAMNDPAINQKTGTQSSTSTQQATQEDENKLVPWIRQSNYNGNALQDSEQFEFMPIREAKQYGWYKGILPGEVITKLSIQLRKRAAQQQQTA